jgi:hypothetical protein
MSSSVSSERAFSQGGITISKRQNRLKGDIVEALQCVKCTIRHDLLFREPEPSSIFEVEVNDANEYGEVAADAENDDEGSETAEGWDNLLLEDEDYSLTTEIVTGSWNGLAVKPMDRGKFCNRTSIVMIRVVSCCCTDGLVFRMDQ